LTLTGSPSGAMINIVAFMTRNGVRVVFMIVVIMIRNWLRIIDSHPPDFLESCRGRIAVKLVYNL
jgi:hypothetical protein